MMIIEEWLAFAATATALLLVPHPLAASAAAYARSWGRPSAFVTVPALVLAVAAVAVFSAAAAFVVAFYLPAAVGALSWAGVAYLMLYTLYAYQDPLMLRGLPDNDNLPETKPARILGHFLVTAFRRTRYLILMAAIFLQFVHTGLPPDQQYAGMIAIIAAATAVSALAYIAFPRLLARRRPRSAPAGQAPHKARTLFIARRAVTAGYRRIAA